MKHSSRTVRRLQRAELIAHFSRLRMYPLYAEEKVLMLHDQTRVVKPTASPLLAVQDIYTNLRTRTNMSISSNTLFTFLSVIVHKAVHLLEIERSVTTSLTLLELLLDFARDLGIFHILLQMADQVDVNGRVEEPEKKEKDKKKKDKEKSADSKEKIQDPAKLRMKLEKIDAKIDVLKGKKEEIIKQLFEIEGDAKN
ncbi:hypothetical protein BHE74_00030917 [Ensete ventricosum]|nr:hypothetical protein BHE74_00030917 [Ensete ventricosum]